ncbi:MAG: porin [Nitratireductor sp.]
MKLKSLLLGSAAVLVAVSGARAADAIVVEPEPVEYVRVCDAYGAGWFYIPGTETCLKFDGDVRVQYGFTHYHDKLPDETSQHEWNYRARLNVRANNETEYGTLASRIRFVAASAEGGHSDALSSAEGPGSAPTVVDWAVISLAGFRVGYADSYWTTAGGYGYYGDTRADGIYDFTESLFFDYTYASNGFTATIGIRSQMTSFQPTGSITGTASQPDVYAGITYSGSGWYLAGIYAYDSSAGNGAYKLRADYDFGNGFNVGGWYMADHGNTDYVHGHGWGVTGSMKLMDNLVLNAGYSDFDAAQSATITDTGRREYTVGLNWTPVPGLRISRNTTLGLMTTKQSMAQTAVGSTYVSFAPSNLTIG